MRKNKLFKHFLTISMLLFLFGTASISAQTSEVLNPTDDSWTKGSNIGTGGPHGSLDVMQVRYRSAGEWRYDAYVKFDISTVDVGLIENAVVRVYTATATAGTPFSLRMNNTTTGWDEETLIASNRPTTLDEVSTIEYTGQAGWYEWDVTALLETLRTGNESAMSLLITPRASESSDEIQFHSKENAESQFHPQLVLTLTEVTPVELVATDIMVDGVTLDGFASDQFTYAVVLPEGTVDVPAVTAVASDETATVTVVPAASLSGTEAERTTTITLARGEEEVVYSVVFEVEVVEPLVATDIMVDGVTLDGFAFDVYTYTIVLPAGTVDVPAVTAVASDETATVTVVPAASLTGTETERTATVTLARDEEEVVYSVVFEVEVVEPLVATDIMVDGVTLDGFSSDQLTYTIVLPEGTVDVPAVTAVASDETATVTVVPAASLTGTETERTTTITLIRDEEEIVYTLVFEIGTLPLVLSPTDDSWTKGHDIGTGGPHGSLEIMQVRYRSAGEWRYDAYLKFDISMVEAGPLENAVVRLYTATATGGTPFSLRMNQTTTNWDEETLIASNRPTTQDELSTIEYTGEAGWYEWDVTTLLETLLAGDESEISFLITPRSSDSSDEIHFHSKENAESQYHPQLVFTFSDENQDELVATDIQVDGVSIANFAADQFTYTMVLPESTVEVPAVTAVASDESATVSIVPAVSLTGTETERTTTITLTRGDEEVVYSIVFELEVVDPGPLVASDISVDGVTLEDFADDKLVYTIVLPANSTDIPVVTATAANDDDSVTIVQAVSLTGTEEERTAKVIISRGDEEVTYSIIFELEDNTSTADLELTPFKYVLRDGALFFDNKGLFSDYQLFTIGGALVGSGNVSPGSNVVELTGRTSGVYLMVLSGLESKTIKVFVP